MATTYTPNYHLGKQTDHGDKFNMTVITDDMDIIDAQMKANADAAAVSNPQILDDYITADNIRFLFSGIRAGVFNMPDIGITSVPGSSYQPGVIRAYLIEAFQESSGKTMQILELASASKVFIRYRVAASGSWDPWVELTENYNIRSSTIDNTALENFHRGAMAGPLDTTITGAGSDIYGIVRAYEMGTLKYMQIAEAVDGTRRTRYQDGTNWSAWA